MKEKNKYQRPQLNVKCNVCNVSFLKDGSEVRRNEKLAKKHYCSLSCVSTGRVSNKNGNLLSLNASNRKDKYTGLREHLARAKKRNKEINIDLDDLLEIWESQKGICPYTGLTLIHPKNAKNHIMLYKASLDRIDSSLGYIKGNIQFISATANLAKGSMTHEEMVTFCRIIAKNWE